MAKLYFYYSAMDAGKSTNLLQTNHNYIERGMQTLLFTSSLDDRYEKGLIYSRIGISHTANIYDSKFDFFDFISKANSAPNNISCVFVDEAQWLTSKQVDQLANVVDSLKISVLTYGLRSDFQGNPFEGSLRLLTIADCLIEVRTMCFCGEKATMNVRLDKSGNIVTEGKQIETGGNEKYVSLCRKHFNLKQIKYN